MKTTLMKPSSTIFLRLTVLGMGLIVLTLCIFLLPAIYAEWGKESTDAMFLRYPVLLDLSITAVAFFVALYQTLKLLHYIDTNTAFSRLSLKALNIIKYCALGISACYTALLPLFYYVANEADAPGFMVIGLFFTFAPLVIAIFATVLQKVLQSAIAIKKENDLTV